MRRDKRQRGSVMAEAALCFSALALLALGAMEFSIWNQARAFCAYAAQDGARWASLNSAKCNVSGCPGLQSYVRAEAAGLETSSATARAYFANGSGAGNPVQVTVSYATPAIFGLALGGNGRAAVTSRSEMVIIR